MSREERAALRRLGRLHGVVPTYRDAGGAVRSATDDALRATLTALGCDPGDSTRAVRQAAEERMQQLARRLVEPVAVSWTDRTPATMARIPPDAAAAFVAARLEREDGEVSSWRLPLEALETVRPEDDRGGALVRIDLPPELPPGYHRLRLEVGGRSAEQQVIRAPRRAWRAPGERRWGGFLPLHALRSDRSWGIGDLGDLRALAAWLGGLGGDAVGTLPLLASFLGEGKEPFDPSPYAPVSRRFWNEIFLDVLRVPFAGACPDLTALANAPATLESIERLSRGDLVDYRTVAALKRTALEQVTACAFRDGMPAGLAAFVRARPEVETYAAFRAATEAHGPWHGWPRGESDAPPAGRPEAVRYHLFVQWALEEQLGAFEREGAVAGLYLDLPLGTHPDGFDAWREEELFVPGVSVGAPPDALFTGGQDWGFPPLHPDRMREDGYQYLRGCLDAQLRHARMLRLDHVMGLHRLYWVPRGLGAREGVYVRYPAEEHYAVLAIESHRHRAELVGEDLGTVPAAVRKAMGAHDMRRMYVVQFEADAGADRPLHTVPAGAVASVNTHDMPTFAGFHQARDVGERVEMGLLREEEAAEHREARERLVRAIADMVGADATAPVATVRAVLRHLADSPAGLVLITLEDLWAEPRPQNLPGTGAERPNWRRRARHTLEEIRRLPEVVESLQTVDRIRK